MNAIMSTALAMLVAVPLALAREDGFSRYELGRPEYRLLRELHRTEVRMWNVSERDGRMLQMLVRMNNTQHVLEVGTSNGVSAIWMALGLRDTGGRLTTLEIDHGRAQMARENFGRAGVDDLVELVEGDALEVLGGLEGTYDLVFIDAAKEQYLDYLELVWDRIPEGGVIVAHNAIRMADSMRDYLDYVLDHPELDTVMLTTGSDGVALSYRKKK